jgi:hypothetical protein
MAFVTTVVTVWTLTFATNATSAERLFIQITTGTSKEMNLYLRSHRRIWKAISTRRTTMITVMTMMTMTTVATVATMTYLLLRLMQVVRQLLKMIASKKSEMANNTTKNDHPEDRDATDM